MIGESNARQDLAIDMGMVARQQYIYKWETGHHSPSLANLERWCAALGYELDLHVKATSDE